MPSTAPADRARGCRGWSGCLVAVGEGVIPAALVGVLDVRAGILLVCLIEAYLRGFRVSVAQALRQCCLSGCRADVLRLLVAEGCSLVVLHLRGSFRVVALDGVQLPAMFRTSAERPSRANGQSGSASRAAMGGEVSISRASLCGTA